jgi:hypothetical protein
VKVDGQQAAVIGQSWSITFDSLPDDPHKFTAVANDAAGNTTLEPKERTVLLDLVSPTVVITEPDPGEPALTRFNAITVRGTVTGRAPLTVKVTGPAVPEGVPATVTGGAWEAVVPLAEGDNTLTAVAKSASGRLSDGASASVTRLDPAHGLARDAGVDRPGGAGSGLVDASTTCRVSSSRFHHGA